MHAVTLSHVTANHGDIAVARSLDAWPADVIRAYLLRARDGSDTTVLLCFRDRLVADAPGGIQSAVVSQSGMAEQTYEVIGEFRVQEWRSADAAMRGGVI